MKASDITDELLTAFLDDEVDPETRAQIERLLDEDPSLAARLRKLQIPMQALQQAFAMTLDAASVDQLAKALDADGGRKARWSWPQGFAVAAMVVLALAIGAGLDRLMLSPDSSRDWRVAVAEYQALYSEDTLTSINIDAAERRASVAHVAGEVGRPFRPEAFENLNGLSFKRAQILRWRDKPLAQFAFLSDQGKPFAFCVKPTEAADRPVENNSLKGLASSSWVRDGFAFIIIGGGDLQFTRDLAAKLSAAI